MEDVLRQLGLNAKETKLYLFLVEKGVMTAAVIGAQLGESRTNTYTLLERLLEQKLVIIDDDTTVRTYAAARPDALKGLIMSRQIELRQAGSGLSSILPELSQLYSLGQHKPGVVYLTGLTGYKKSLDDMARSNQVVSVLASDITHENPEAWEALGHYAYARKNTTAHSRIILQAATVTLGEIKNLIARGYEVRFWGGQPHPGEIAIYGDKIALTVYQPNLVVTVITNQVLATTFKIIFEQLWAASEAPKPMHKRS